MKHRWGCPKLASQNFNRYYFGICLFTHKRMMSGIWENQPPKTAQSMALSSCRLASDGCSLAATARPRSGSTAKHPSAYSPSARTAGHQLGDREKQCNFEQIPVTNTLYINIFCIFPMLHQDQSSLCWRYLHQLGS